MFLVPIPDIVNVAVISTQTVGQPLTLECNVTTVRGITSRMDIVWSSSSTVLKRTKGMNGTFTSDNSVAYTDSYDAVQINTSDNGRVYVCEMFMSTSSPVVIDGNTTLDVTG